MIKITHRIADNKATELNMVALFLPADGFVSKVPYCLQLCEPRDEVENSLALYCQKDRKITV